MPENTLISESNVLTISGAVCSEIKFSHQIYGEGFYSFQIKSDRLSGSQDVLPVTLSERIIEGKEIVLGQKVTISGQIRSYNSMENKRNRLVLAIFARDILFDQEDELNNVFLDGYLCKPPVYRVTPFGREIADVLLAVNRAYSKSDYIPCIFWGRNAKYMSGLKTGDNIKVWGRVQSRAYQKKTEEGIEERVAYEISVARLEKSNEE